MKREAISRPTSSSRSGKNTNKNANRGPSPRESNEKTRMRAETSNDANREASKPKKYTVQEYRSKRIPTPKRSPAPSQFKLKSTNFTSLFAAPPSLSATRSSTSTKTTPTGNATCRLQRALEYHGGDYSKLASSSLVTSQGDPVVYAEGTMVRRRDLGPNRRGGALGIIRGMIGKSRGSRLTA